MFVCYYRTEKTESRENRKKKMVMSDARCKTSISLSTDYVLFVVSCVIVFFANHVAFFSISAGYPSEKMALKITTTIILFHHYVKRFDIGCRLRMM